MIKLMVVDDSNVIRRKIERSVDVDDLSVVGTAANGMEAVDVFKDTLPDVVTMDITMPEMDGIDCVTALLKIKSDTRILVVSALADKATAIEAIKRGANGFLCKPFSANELNQAFKELLEM